MPTGRSRIDILNVAAKTRQMPSLTYDVLMGIGVASWGPMHVATTVVDYADFYEKFGGYLASYQLPLQVKKFFDGGGRRAVITRVCHITDHEAGNTPASAAKATVTLNADDAGGYSGTPTLTVEALYYGTFGNRLKVKIQDASNGESHRFDLLVYLDDQLVPGEWYRNLSMLDSDAAYVETVINTAAGASKYIRVADLDVGGVGGVAADQRPETVAATALTGGDDGLTSMATADYVGSATHTTGLYAFNLAREGDMLICPDDTTTSFQNSATTYCEVTKQGKVLFITDPPASSDKAGIVVQAASLNASESRTKIYWPRVKIANPDKTTYGQGQTIVVCPSGMLAARMAKNSQVEEAMMWVQPSNEIYGLLQDAVGLESDAVLDDGVRDYVTDYGINPIVSGIRATDGNFGVWADDCLVGKQTGNFKSIGAARGVAYLRKVFEAYLQQHRTQNNSRDRRQTIKEDLEAELLKWCMRKAFATTVAADAFYVNTDVEGVGLNNPVVQSEQRLRVLVGIADAEPARFIELMFTKDTRAVESWIQQQSAANS